MKKIHNILLLRLIAKFFPMKLKLNFLIKKYLRTKYSLVIPYFDKYSIVIDPNIVSKSTINHLIFEGGAYLPEFNLLQKIKRRLGKNYVVVDAGANIGTIIWQLAKDCSHIFAFEPIPKLNNIIETSSSYNQFNRLTIYGKALGDKLGHLIMLDNDNSAVVDKYTDKRIIEVEVTTLDSTLKDVEKIDLLKIDVEGFEWNVLQGAKGILKAHKPLLLIEIHPVFLKNYGIDYNLIIDLLENYNYHIEYYSFLEETRKGRLFRLFSRYLPNTGRQFTGRSAFAEDIEQLPTKLSYHLYCESK